MQRMHERHRAAIARLAVVRALSPEHRARVLDGGEVLTFEPRSFVFKKGDGDPRAYFLLEGRVDLVSEGQLIKTVEGGGPAAERMLAQTSPRRLSALSCTSVTVFAVDPGIVGSGARGPGAGTSRPVEGDTVVEVADIEQNDDDDWMTRLLQSKLLSRLPAGNIQQLFARMQAVEHAAGDIVARQGDAGEHYHVVRDGRCVVTRHDGGDRSSAIKLAELGQGDAFGEEALVPGGVHGATVRMLSAGTLMRLAKPDFETLVRLPCTEALDVTQASGRVRAGAIWLDVRGPAATGSPAPAGTVAVPMSTLPMRVQRLDPARSYVTLCESGEASATAAFVLVRHGFEAAYLSGGLRGAGELPGVADLAAAPRVGPAERERARPSPGAERARLEEARRALERRVKAERAKLAERARESEQRVASAVEQKERAEAERELLSRNLEDSLRTSRSQLETEAKRADAAMADVERLKSEVEAARRAAARERGVKEARERELESVRKRAEARFAREELRIREEQRRHDDELGELRSRREVLERELEAVRERLNEAEDGRRVAEVEARRERLERKAATVPASEPVAERQKTFAETREDLKRALAAERAEVRAERERLELQANRLQTLLEEVRRMREESDVCHDGTRAPVQGPQRLAPARADASHAPAKGREPRTAPAVKGDHGPRSGEQPDGEPPCVATPQAEPASPHWHGHVEADENRVLGRDRLALIRRATAGRT